MLKHPTVSAVVGAVVGAIVSFLLVKMPIEPVIGAAIVGIYIAIILVTIQTKTTKGEEEKNSVVIKTRNHTKSPSDLIKQAKTEIFFSGFTLTLLMPEIGTLLEKAKAGVKVKILFVDLEDKELVRAYEKIEGYEFDELSHTQFKRCLNKSNIEIRVINFFMPVDFAAIDMDKNDGYIRAHHRFSNSLSKEHPNIELTRANKWYDDYNKQLNTVWSKGTPWNGK